VSSASGSDGGSTDLHVVNAGEQTARRVKVRTKKKTSCAVPLLAEHFPAHSKHAPVALEIINQPETQHRARYLTEGSRGAIKDRSGEGYPVVKVRRSQFSRFVLNVCFPVYQKGWVQRIKNEG
jgi:hypothetical protein